MTEIDERFYADAAREVADRTVIAGLMAKAFSEADGDERKAAAKLERMTSLASTLAQMLKAQVHPVQMCMQRYMEIQYQLLHLVHVIHNVVLHSD